MAAALTPTSGKGGKLCENCGNKRACFGLMDGERKLRWCAACAHELAPSAEDLTRRRCEDCEGIMRSVRYDLKAGTPHCAGKGRWCAHARPRHAPYIMRTAVSLTIRSLNRAETNIMQFG